MHEGTGMGLTIVKEIVEKLGGAIKVISPSKLAEKERPGTSFEISLPFNYKPLGYDIFAVNDDEYLKNKSDF
jgi:signal transduction histidine kinase